ncbi:MAG: radical SAM protein [Proteobacteria bacterium]|nr:radical SAM protein [Pseudomonadota bacterium]MBU1686726.1 radical SAM protein [Pseudomonadota bacterium]
MLNRLWQYLDIRQSRYRQRPPASLPILLFWVTDRCNLRCRMCGDQWRVELQHDRSPLTMPEISRVIDSARRLKTLIISLTGGEPLLHPGIFDILDLIRNAGISANMCTNGTLLTEDLVKRLARTSLKSISVSLDGPGEEEHDHVRRHRGAFQATTNGIRLLKEAMPQLMVNINCTVTRRNFQELQKMVELTSRLGCNKISFAPVHTNLQHKEKPLELFQGQLFAPEDMVLLQRELENVVNLANSKGIRTSSRPFLRGIPRLYLESPAQHTCYAGYASAALSPWGDLAPCVDMASSLNVRDMPLEEIWKSSAFQGLRDQVDRCRTPCWDTTNAEIAIRFSAAGLFGELATLRREIMTYGKIS